MKPAALLALFTLLAVPAFPQGSAASQAKAIPRLPDGKPDFSGIWIGGGPVADLEAGLKPGETIPLLPAARS